MKIPLSWLKEYLPLETTPQMIADCLTLLGLEVDSAEPRPLNFEGVVVGKVIAAAKHPNADKLTVATVFDGTEELQIVCGASNCREGIKVALARVGATLKDEEGKSFKIKKGKLRDVESFGMLCAIDELGLGPRSEGILELPDAWKEGTDLSEIYGDTIFEISLTPNLGHCLSVLGVARELAAKMKLHLKKPFTLVKENPQDKIENLVTVNILDKEGCSHYGCRVVKGVKVGPSPDWMRLKLEAAGIRSINNIVDVSNYVMLESGQPLHMFDYDTLRGKAITVTSKTTFPKLTTLDGVLRDIPDGTLLICDGEEPIAFAGVMGGNDSAVGATTQNVLIEAAHFSPQAIRKAAKQLGLRTDASHRFERGVDPLAIPDALNRAAYLLQEVAGGTAAEGIIECVAVPFLPTKVYCRTARVNAMLGTDLSQGEIVSLLKRLEIQIEKEDDAGIHAIIPSYRNDLKEEIDLIEEAARIYGYNNIPLNPPRYTSSTLDHSPVYLFERETRSLLLNAGLTELHTCDLISPFLTELTKENSLPESSIVHVLHPSSVEQSILRVSLLPGLLQVVKNNLDHQNFDISGFEVGKIHFKEGNAFKEPSMAAIVMTGGLAPYHWDPKPQPVDFFDLKGKVENFLAALGIEGAEFEVSHLHNFHPGRQARIKVKDVYVGAIGEVHPMHLRKLDIKQRVYFAEVNLIDLMQLKRKEIKVEPLSLYPGSERDWTLTLKEELPIGDVLSAIAGVPSRLLETISLLDLYKSEQIGKDKKNATFRFFYRDKEKTIAQETVDLEHTRITQEVAKKLRDHIL